MFIERDSGQSSLTISEEAATTASRQGFAETVSLLIGEMGSSEFCQSTLNHALIVASREFHTEVAVRLVREGVNVNAVVEVLPVPWDQTDYLLCSDRIEVSAPRTNALQAAVRYSSLGLIYYDHPIQGSG